MKIMSSLLYAWFVSFVACSSSIQNGDYPASGSSKSPKSEPVKGEENTAQSDSSVKSSAKKPTEKLKAENNNKSNEVDNTKAKDNSSPSVPSVDSNLVKFTIRNGTGRGPWNSASEPIRVKQGQTLEITNGDSTLHWVHTSGGPFPHPIRGIAPGTSATYKISSTNTGGVFDHTTFGRIYIEMAK